MSFSNPYLPRIGNNHDKGIGEDINPDYRYDYGEAETKDINYYYFAKEEEDDKKEEEETKNEML